MEALKHSAPSALLIQQVKLLHQSASLVMSVPSEASGLIAGPLQQISGCSQPQSQGQPLLEAAGLRRSTGQERGDYALRGPTVSNRPQNSPQKRYAKTVAAIRNGRAAGWTRAVSGSPWNPGTTAGYEDAQRALGHLHSPNFPIAAYPSPPAELGNLPSKSSDDISSGP
jgi:hypothetical protein